MVYGAILDWPGGIWLHLQKVIWIVFDDVEIMLFGDGVD
jgi:hypothetical protein